MQDTQRYSYAARPKELSRSSNKVKQILRTCNAEKIEKLIRDGDGYKLIGEYSSDPKIRNLLKAVPFYMARIDMLHNAVTRGQLRDVQVLTKITSPVYSVLKPKPENMVTSKDSSGAGLLHKAVFYDYPQIVEWLIQNFPHIVHVQDKLARIPLHYACATSEPNHLWQLLVNAGSRTDVDDVHGRAPLYYLTNNAEIHLPDKSRFDNLRNEEMRCSLSNIRIWIQDQDINRLQQVIWEGQGAKLATQNSRKPLMKKFLDGVPYVMAVIREIHRAAINNDVNTLIQQCGKPVPFIILKSKDENGVTPLHKAAGLGNDNIVEYILSRYPAAIHVGDNEDRTPAHYAIAFKRKIIYQKLLLAGANENIIDKNGKRVKSLQSQGESIDTALLHKLPSVPDEELNKINASTFDWTILQASDASERAKNVNAESWTSNENDEKTDIYFEIVEKNTEVENDSANCAGDTRSVSAHAQNIQVVSHDSEPSTNISRKGGNDHEDNTSRTTVEIDALAPQTPTNPQPHEPPFKPHTQEKSQTPENECKTPATEPTTSYTIEFSQTSEKELPSEGSEDQTTKNVDVSIDNMLKYNNVEELGNFILQGYGELLLDSKSNNEQIQQFINHLPIFLKQIDLIHHCCMIGDLTELQKYLDRRKLATARENKTSLYLTPLHIAVANNNVSVAKYLASRFPETLKVVDRLGRTPLHFAGIHLEGKYMYNMLLTLGADKTVKDENTYTAEYYYEHPYDERYIQIETVMNRLKNRDKSQDSILNSNELLNEVTKFNRSERDYIFTVLGEALKTGLLAVVHTRPTQPIKFLAEYLHSFKENTNEQGPRSSEKVEDIFVVANENANDQINEGENTEQKQNVSIQSHPGDGHLEKETTVELEVEINSVTKLINDYDRASSNQFQPLSRDKYGQTAIHYAATRSHGRNALLQMLHELNGSVAVRDELYRTARDIATFSERYENVQTIDEYVLHIAANGESEKIMQLLVDGYDHILEMECQENIIECVTKRGHLESLAVLRTIPRFKKIRDEFHSAIKNGTKLQVMQILRQCGKDALLMATCRSYTFKCSLHIAMLTQKKDIIKYIIKKFPETLSIGDNLDRTALHYAMALDSVEQLSSLLIKAGADRIAKDLKGRQPSYYFINKLEILQMQQELC